MIEDCLIVLFLVILFFVIISNIWTLVGIAAFFVLIKMLFS
nr:MAG TPA: hypothetical protein [Caudoviricetes sp.]